MAPAFESELQLALTGLDLQLRPQRLVLEPPRHVDDHLAPRQPALAGAVGVGIGGLAQSHVTPDIEVPAPEVGVDVGVVAVGGVGDPLRRSKVDAARHWFASVVVHDRRVHPVSAAIDDFDLEPRVRLRTPLFEHISPAHVAYGLAAVLDGDRCRWSRGDLDLAGAALLTLGLTPSLAVVVEEFIRRHLR